MIKLEPPISSVSPFQFRKGDWNGFLTLVTDNLTKIVLLPNFQPSRQTAET